MSTASKMGRPPLVEKAGHARIAGKVPPEVKAGAEHYLVDLKRVRSDATIGDVIEEAIRLLLRERRAEYITDQPSKDAA